MTVRAWVKICGVTRVEDADLASTAGADAVGLNFSLRSPRRCDLQTANRIVKRVGTRVTVFGVFVDAERPEIEYVLRTTGIAGIQLHGHEPEALARGWSVPVLRAVAVESRQGVVEALDAAIGYRVLLDSPRGGGSGSKFDLAMVDGVGLSEAVIAGGLTPENVADRVRRLCPWGVDVASGVEISPGIKDAPRVVEFVRNAKSPG